MKKASYTNWHITHRFANRVYMENGVDTQRYIYRVQYFGPDARIIRVPRWAKNLSAMPTMNEFAEYAIYE